MNYWTVQVHYLSKDETGKEVNAVHELKDFDDMGIKDFSLTVWVKGFRIQSSPIMWELINPFRIITVFIIKQDKKHSI